jgi:ribosome biogenesis GTPase
MKARELGRRGVVVGDHVDLAGDVSGAAGTLARIVRVQPRTSVLRRSADDSDPLERVIVANASQLVIVCALADPAPGLRFVDRCLVAAYDAGLTPLLVLTKADLAEASSVLEIERLYEPLGLRSLVTKRPLTDSELSPVRDAVAGQVSVLIGQSGVGKSTLVNALIPSALRAVGTVNPVTGRGRHTSSSAVALPLGPVGSADSRAQGSRGSKRSVTSVGSAGWLIDTPGLRGFGLGHVTPARLVEAFGDLAEGTANCPPGCDHLSPDCALDEWAREHHAEARLDSLRRLLRSRESSDLA